MSRNEQPSHPIQRVTFADAMPQGVVFGPGGGSRRCCCCPNGSHETGQRPAQRVATPHRNCDGTRLRDPKCPTQYPHATGGVVPTAPGSVPTRRDQPQRRATGRHTRPRSRCTTVESANDPHDRTGSHRAPTPQPNPHARHRRPTAPPPRRAPPC